MSYQYQSLPPKHIRVLHLFPGARTNALKGRLVIVYLYDNLVYDALSYM